MTIRERMIGMLIAVLVILVSAYYGWKITVAHYGMTDPSSGWKLLLCCVGLVAGVVLLFISTSEKGQEWL